VQARATSEIDHSCNDFVSARRAAVPPPVTGQISGAGNRIPLQIEVTGPSGEAQENAIPDTGGVDEYLPDADLRAAGFTPTGTTASSIARWTGTVNEYSIPASSLLVLNAGKYVPLAIGTLAVFGAPSAAFSGGLEPIGGPNVLQQGAQLSSSGSQ
jgi:hypothetical protein